MTNPGGDLTDVAGVCRFVPYRLMRYWNWKVALLSGVSRALIFMALTIGWGWKRAAVSMAVEATFRAATVGFYGAITQALRDWKPVWLTALGITVVLPVSSQWLDSLLHSWLATPNLRLGTAVSLAVSSFACFFDWYAMRRGALLVGQESGSFWRDVRVLPTLFVQLVLSPVRQGQRQNPELEDV